MQIIGARRGALAFLLVVVVTVLAAASCRPAAADARSPAAKAAVPDRAPPPIQRARLDKLLERATASNSDAIVIMQDGKLVGEWYFGKPRGRIELMSATKSIVNLAIGRLIDTGKLTSLDQPVHELYPEWGQGKKRAITIRHLLNHTSGLQNELRTDVEIYPSPDFVKLALAAELSDAPGTSFAYNNKAVNLLAGIVKVASGKRMDEYIRDEIFAPLGITDFGWTLDPAGNPHAMSGLQMHAVDVAKIGQMLLEGGVWNGKRIISSAWLAESTKPGQALDPRCGLLWWLVRDYRRVILDDAVLAAWRAGGVSEDLIRRVLPLKDKVFTATAPFRAALEGALGGEPGMELWENQIRRKGLPTSAWLPTPVKGFNANGYLGQYLVVIPSQRIVAVRQMRTPDPWPEDESKIDGFSDFMELVSQLTTR